MSRPIYGLENELIVARANSSRFVLAQSSALVLPVTTPLGDDCCAKKASVSVKSSGFGQLWSTVFMIAPFERKGAEASGAFRRPLLLAKFALPRSTTQKVESPAEMC